MQCDQTTSVYRSGSSFASALLSNKIAEPLNLEPSAVERLRVVELNDEESTVCSLETPAAAELSVED